MSPAARRKIIWRDMDVLIDVGANRGQYAKWARSQGFSGHLISFEPVPDLYEELAAHASSDGDWEAHNYALGATDGTVPLHVARNEVSSSVHLPTDAHRTIDPNTAEVALISAQMRSLTSLWPSLGCDGRTVFLKIDVEGYEDEVLRGGIGILGAVSAAELELSLTPMYRGGALLDQVMPVLLAHGFSVLALEPNHGDDPKTGQSLMVDAVFIRAAGDQ
jgi:FkbM family methyltransferase